MSLRGDIIHFPKVLRAAHFHRSGWFTCSHGIQAICALPGRMQHAGVVSSSAKASRQEGFSQLLKDEGINPVSARLSSFLLGGCSEIPSGRLLTQGGGQVGAQLVRAFG